MTKTKTKKDPKVTEQSINSSKKQKTPEPVQEPESSVEEGMNEESEEENLLADQFVLECGGYFDETDVLELELPKFLLSNSLSNIQNVCEKSSIIVYLMNNPTNPDLGLRIIKAIKEGFKEFKIGLLDLDGDIGSLWSFDNVRIKAVDMGSLMPGRSKEPRAIQIELEYDHFSIDEESITD